MLSANVCWLDDCRHLHCRVAAGSYREIAQSSVGQAVTVAADLRFRALAHCSDLGRCVPQTEGQYPSTLKAGVAEFSAGTVLYAKQSACRTINAIDLRALDRHPDAAVTSLVPALSCRSCRPNAPFAELVRLSRSRYRRAHPCFDCRYRERN
jgi:hypothetical protein